MQQPSPAGMPRSASASLVGPAVAEAHKVFNFGECFIALEELLAYAPDNSSNIGLIALFSAPSDEALVVCAVVDRSIGHPATCLRRQEMDNVVLAQGETHIPVVPICPPDVRIEEELSADDTGRADCSRFWCFQQSPQTPDQNFNAPSLVDEIDGPRLEREVFLIREAITRKKHHRQVHTAPAQRDEHFDARYVWKVPVEKDDVSLTGDGEPVSQRKGVGKATDDKPMIRQLISNGLATIRVVLDVKDPDEVSLQFSYLLVCSSRFSVSRFILIHHRVSTFSGEYLRHALVANRGWRSKNASRISYGREYGGPVRKIRKKGRIWPVTTSRSPAISTSAPAARSIGL